MKTVLSRVALQNIIKNIKNPAIGQVWIHKRTRDEYKVVNFSLRSKDCKPDVVYTRNEQMESMDDRRVYWSRDLNEFLDRFNKVN